MYKAYIQLGRSGDEILLAPCWKRIFDTTGVKPVVISSREYVGVLDGMSYVQAESLDVHWYKGMPQAREFARLKYGSGNYTITQCHGHDKGVDMTKYPTFGETMWAEAGFPNQYGQFPMVFDRRNRERENALTQRFMQNFKPLLLVNFQGISSPFSLGTRFMSDIMRAARDFRVVDLSKVRASRIYDLLGLYDIAAGLITIDTATLHLAGASTIPMFAFTVDGWNSAVPQGKNCVQAIPYSQALTQQPALMNFIQKLPRQPRVDSAEIFHVYTAYEPKDPETIRRNKLAQETWKVQPWVEVPVKDEQLPRMWEEEGKRWPYIKDVIDFAITGKPDNAIICYTNADIHVRSDCCNQIRAALARSDAVYCFRRDFGRLDAPIPDQNYHAGYDYCGSDLKAFRVSWWKRYRSRMGDMILGGEAWDPMMRLLIDRTNHMRPTKLKDLIAHERHASFWEQPSNRYRLNMQKHCLRTAYRWFQSHGVNPANYGIKLV